jgi:UDP-glucose:(heptosyl)LPS alpha-1,3-glucosyltransferase
MAARVDLLMRIVFMHRQLVGGGTEADLLRMATGLTARGHELHVCAAETAGAPPGIQTHRVPVLHAGRTARLLSFAVLAPRLAMRLGCDVVVGFGRTLRQDVIRVGGGTHASYLTAMQAAGVRRGGAGPYHRAILWLERRMFAPGSQRGVLAVSRRAADEVITDYGVPAERVRVVYNGVDLERFRPGRQTAAAQHVRHALGLAPGERACLAVGSGYVRKGFDLLVRLWREDPPPGTHLVLVGRDERLAAFRREARDEKVHVLGPRDDVPVLMAAADVVCVPSRQEAFGNVVLEAMASGTPVVTSRVVGAAELLEPPLDRLIVERPDALADVRRALVQALGDEHARYAAAARMAAEARPWSRHLDEVEAVLEGWTE